MFYKNSIYLVKIICVVVVYFLTARIGLSISSVNGFATLIWIPSGIALAILLCNFRLWPAILVAAFLVNATIGATVPSAVAISIGNTLEAVVAVFLLRRMSFHLAFNRTKDIYVFIFSIGISAIIAALFGTTSLFTQRTITHSAYISTVTTWWFGDFMSMLIFTPFLLTWFIGYRDVLRNFSYKRFFEALGLTICIVLLSGFIYWGGPAIFTNAPKTYLIFPFLIWTALRFGMEGATTIVVLIFALASSGAILGIGPLGGETIAVRLALVQGFLTITTLTTFILAVVNTERKELDKRKDDFISMASHELKTPLTSIKMFVQILLKQSTKNSKMKKMLARTNVQIDQLTTLVNDLLDVTKIEQGKLELKKEKFYVKSIIEDIIHELQLSTHQHLVVKMSSNPAIFTDKQRFQQVITNIVINAIKFSSHESKIIVSSQEKSRILVISIQDFGIGIPQSEQMYVFERFYQIKKDNRDTYPGVGLGLFIVKDLSTRMGGNVWFESTEGKGSTFYFSLPMYKRT